MTGFSRGALRQGMRRSLPIVIGLTPFGLVAGVLAQGHGLSMAEATLMSALCFAGSAQILVLGHWGVPAPIAAATLATFVVNLRMALMGPVLAPWLDRLRGWRLLATLFVMADHNWALSVEQMRRGGSDAAFLFGSGAMIWVAWVITTMLGHWMGGLVQPAPGHPLFFAALAAFVALLCGIWRGRNDALPWGVAAAAAILTAHVLPGTWYIVAGALAGSLAGAVRDRAARMTLDPATMAAISGMTVVTFACRAGGYWLFRQIRPSPAVRAMLGYLPGALFVSYVAPALLDGGPMQWAGAAATAALMLTSGNLSVAILGGTAAAWALWSLR